MKMRIIFTSLLIFVSIFVGAKQLVNMSLDVRIVNQDTIRFTDSRDGKTYKIVKIGSQIWMAENLNFKTSKGSWCYDDKNLNCNEFGRLYDWETAKTVCPEGWHLPSESEFKTLLRYVESNGTNVFGDLVIDGNSGFSALLGGRRYSDNECTSLGEFGHFWSSSASDFSRAWSLLIYKHTETVNMRSSFTSIGYSVRCVKN
jgi:uncharacterized protein (TIGR02145 family)